MAIPAHEDVLSELQSVISKMSLGDCSLGVLPELGLSWTEVKEMVRYSRLPMTSASVARVLRVHVSKRFTIEETHYLLALLRIKMVATSSSRMWHCVRLSEPLRDAEPAAEWARRLPGRVSRAAVRLLKNTRITVHSCKLGDFLFLSLSRARTAPSMYVCVSLGQPVCAVTSLGATLLRAAVEGLGYKHYEDMQLYGRDFISLLKISDRRHNVDVGQLLAPPVYQPVPTVSPHSIDYTYQTYNEQYVEKLIGADPPMINNLNIKFNELFFDPERINKNISVSLHIKSDDLAKTLKHCVAIKAIAPTSPFFRIFHKLQSNTITYDREEYQDSANGGR